MKKIIIPGISAALHKYIFSDEFSIETRILNANYVTGILATILADTARFVLGKNIWVGIIIGCTTAMIPILMCITNRFGIYTIPRNFFIIVQCYIIFPVVYFLMGGLNSAMTGYFTLSIVIVFLLVRGKTRIIFLILNIIIICLCYYLSSLPQFAQYIDNRKINRYLDQIQTILIVGIYIGVIISFQNRLYRDEREKAIAAGKDITRQNKLLGVVNRIAEMLLSSEMEDLGKTVQEAMDILAHCIDADRMYVWRKRIINGNSHYQQEYGWLGVFGKDLSLSIQTGHSYIEVIPQWEKNFLEGKVVNAPIQELSEEEYNFLKSFGIHSILVIPLFLQNQFWGFVSFDDCLKERTFSGEEVNILRSGSLLLANAVVRKANMLIIEARMQQQELMAHISQSFISRESMESLIENALLRIGEFMKVTRVLVTVADKETGTSHPAYVWFKSEEWRPKPVQAGFNDFISNSFPQTVSSGSFITPLCCSDTINEEGGKYVVFIKAGVRAFIWAPVYVEGVFWGLVTIQECERTRNWSESDLQLAGTISSAISGAVSRDVMDKERAAALEQAVNASKAKGNFLANMSHEMRTPMNAIIGMLSIGKSAGTIEKKDYAFGKIEDASTHLLGVINDVLDMSKIEANKLELSYVTFNFEKMLQKVVNVINFRIDERRQNFTVKIDENIPRFLVGDDQRLVQVITNLLSNAVKFTPEQGSISLTTRMSGEENGIYTIQIEVKDSGIGISPEQQAKLFNSFAQAESGTSRKFGGTGLGLAISKRIVEMMGGSIWIESELGKGSTFAFTIQAEKGHGAYAKMLAPGVNIKTLRILSIDDSPEILEYIGSIMRRFGIKCDVAKSGEEALALIEKNGSYDLYFVDWKMPGMNGIEVSRKIKESTANKSVVIMISAAEWSTIEKDAQEAGVDKFLSKPLFPSSIADTINECLGVSDLEETGEKAAAEEVDHFDGHIILLAEDVDINREIVLTLLEPTALTIDCAENGARAVEMFKAAPNKYDMIFMDVQMPEMDGYEATRTIRNADPDWAKRIPIVAMTANVFREDIERCLAAGMNDHVGKPLDLNEVLEKLRKYLPAKQLYT